jgi:hypothetical protein
MGVQHTPRLKYRCTYRISGAWNELKVITKWFVIDLLKLISRLGIAVAIFIAVLAIRLFRPAYSFIDTLLILVVGMILGVAYLQIQGRASGYFDKQSKPALVQQT